MLWNCFTNRCQYHDGDASATAAAACCLLPTTVALVLSDITNSHKSPTQTTTPTF
jgi:hypothetical protein